MTFFEKNEENLEALVFALTEREKPIIVIGIVDADQTREKAITYINHEFKDKQSYIFDFFGKETPSLLAFFRENLPKNASTDLPIVHITRLDPLLFTTKNHKVVSSDLVAQLNMERELLFREVQGLIILWIRRESYNRLRMDAPDFMDWVVASFIFENDVETQNPTWSFEIPQQTIDDKSKATTFELEQKAEKLQQRTLKFEQNKKLTIRDKKEYFNLLLALIDAYKNLHNLEKTQKTLKIAYDLAKANNLAYGFEFGKLLGDWGETETNLGNLDKAVILFEEALQHFELLGDKANVAVSYSKLGETHSTLGYLDKALGYFEERNKLGKELYDAYPTNVEFKNGLAISYSKLGETHSSLGNLDKALGYFEDFNRLGKELYDAYPANVEFKNGLAISYSKLGETHSTLGNLDKALDYFEKDIELSKELYDAYPKNVSFKNSLAISYEKLGETHSSLGNLDKALGYFEEYNRLGKELYDAYPTNVEFKNGLAISYEKLGSTHSSLGNLDKALGYFEKDIELSKELYAAYPQNVSFKNGLAISYSKLGSTHSSLGNLEKALSAYSVTNQMFEELYAAYPQNVDFKNGLAVSYSKLGEAHSGLGNLDAALQYFEEYNRLEKELYDTYPTNVNFKNGLALSYANLGAVSRDELKDNKKAKTYFQEAEKLWSELVRDAPQYAQFQQFLKMVQQNIKSLD